MPLEAAYHCHYRSSVSLFEIESISCLQMMGFTWQGVIVQFLKFPEKNVDHEVDDCHGCITSPAGN